MICFAPTTKTFISGQADDFDARLRVHYGQGFGMANVNTLDCSLPILIVNAHQ